MMMGLKQKIVIFANGILFFACLLIGVFSYQTANSGFEIALETKAKNDINTTLAYWDVKYPGEWSLKNGKLYKGSHLIGGNHDAVDEIKRLNGDDVTIFNKDVRVTTTYVKDGGERATGTKASPEIAAQVLSGNSFAGQAEVLGNKYYCAYAPLKDNNNNVVGMVYMGVPAGITAAIQNEFIRNMVLIVAVLSIVLGAIVWRIAVKQVQRILYIRDFALKLADGDLSVPDLVVQGKDEIGDCVASINTMKGQLAHVITTVAESATRLAAASQELTASSQLAGEAIRQVADNSVTMTGEAASQQTKVSEAIDQAQGFNKHMADLRSVATTLGQVADASKAGAEDGSRSVTKAISAMDVISEKMKKSNEVVKALGSQSEKVGSIVDTIFDISQQTNLLALNAAIEAAHAGEAGKGFAVVAEEVRKLAEESTKAAQNISSMIASIRGEINEVITAIEENDAEVATGADVVKKTGEMFEGIKSNAADVAASVEKAYEVIQNVGQSVEAITQAIDGIGQASIKVTDATRNVSATTEEQAASISEIAKASSDLANLACELQNEIAKFTL